MASIRETTESINDLSLTSHDSKDVPKLDHSISKHYEKVVCFLAYRSLYIQYRPEGEDEVRWLVEAHDKSRCFLTPGTTQSTLIQILTDLVLDGDFQCNSNLQQSFHDLSEEMINKQADGVPTWDGKSYGYRPQVALREKDWAEPGDNRMKLSFYPKHSHRIIFGTAIQKKIIQWLWNMVSVMLFRWVLSNRNDIFQKEFWSNVWEHYDVPLHMHYLHFPTPDHLRRPEFESILLRIGSLEHILHQDVDLHPIQIEGILTDCVWAAHFLQDELCFKVFKFIHAGIHPLVDFILARPGVPGDYWFDMREDDISPHRREFWKSMRWGFWMWETNDILKVDRMLQKYAER